MVLVNQSFALKARVIYVQVIPLLKRSRNRQPSTVISRASRPQNVACVLHAP